MGIEKVATKFAEGATKQVTHAESKLADLAAKGLTKTEEHGSSTILKTADQVANHQSGKSITSVSLTTEKVRLGRTVKPQPVVKHDVPLTKATKATQKQAMPVTPVAAAADDLFRHKLDQAVSKLTYGPADMPTAVVCLNASKEIPSLANLSADWAVWSAANVEKVASGAADVPRSLLTKPFHFVPGSALEALSGKADYQATLKAFKANLGHMTQGQADKKLLFEAPVPWATMASPSVHPFWKELGNGEFPLIAENMLVEAKGLTELDAKIAEVAVPGGGQTVTTVQVADKSSQHIPVLRDASVFHQWTAQEVVGFLHAPERFAGIATKPRHFLSTAVFDKYPSKLTPERLQRFQELLNAKGGADRSLILETDANSAWAKQFQEKWPVQGTFEPKTFGAQRVIVDQEVWARRNGTAAAKKAGLSEVELSFGNKVTRRHLTVIEPKQDVNSLQGIDALRTFIKQQKVAASDIGKAAGLDQPKGIVVVGPPGTGKSAVAEAIGTDLDRPVVRISPSDYKGNLVGESEKNFRNIIESIKGKDVVLWIDEVEKAFPAPSQSLGTSADGGVLNEFLTFLNENESVYTVMTSNDPTAVAPELIRKGRMDDVFYVGLPEESARAAIFKTHLEKRGWSMSDEHLKVLAEKTQGFSGAEIEQAVKEGIRNAFFENVQKGLPTEQFQPPVVQDFIDAVSKSKPVSVTNKAQVDKIQSWSREVQARDAAGERTDAILPGKGGGLTELLPVRVDGNDLGGFEHYKKWIQQRSALMTPEARAKGLPMPKGVMLVGVQGSGKSLGAEVTASMLNRPLIKLSMAKIAEGNVAENLRKAIVEIQQAKHCVVLIDEFEKAMQLRRAAPEAAAEFLTFLNEQDQAFIAATANDLSQMPPEYMRKGRFDEIFFVDLPNQSERESIFKALVDKVDQEHIELYSTDLETLATAAKGYTGAEIKAALESARITAFADGGRNATVQDVLEALKETTPASKGMADKVQQMRQNAMEIGRPVGQGYVN